MAKTRTPGKTRSFTPLQDEILKVATDVIGPRVAVRIVYRKFAEAQVRLTAREQRELHQLIVSGRLKRFSLTRQRKSPPVVTFTAADGEAFTVEATNEAIALFNRELKRRKRYAANLLVGLHAKWPSERTLMPTLETQQLILREWRLDDFDQFGAMMADPKVMEFLAADGKPMPRFGAWRAFTYMVGHWTLRGFGMFAVVEKSSGALVGRVGPWEPEGWPEFEIGWTLRSEYWGRGYATEAARRCVDYVFQDLGRTHFISLISPENTRSIRVAERIGECLEGPVTLPHMPDRQVLQYGRSRE